MQLGNTISELTAFHRPLAVAAGYTAILGSQPSLPLYKHVQIGTGLQLNISSVLIDFADYFAGTYAVESL
jgi:hypothetical protein